MAAETAVEVMVNTENKQEAEEVMELLKMLDPYEKREFLGYIKGAKMVKAMQPAASPEVATA